MRFRRSLFFTLLIGAVALVTAAPDLRKVQETSEVATAIEAAAVPTTVASNNMVQEAPAVAPVAEVATTEEHEHEHRQLTWGHHGHNWWNKGWWTNKFHSNHNDQWNEQQRALWNQQHPHNQFNFQQWQQWKWSHPNNRLPVWNGQNVNWNNHQWIQWNNNNPNNQFPWWALWNQNNNWSNQWRNNNNGQWANGQWQQWRKDVVVKPGNLRKLAAEEAPQN